VALAWSNRAGSTLIAEAEFQIKQIREILHNKMAKRGIDLGCLDEGESSNLAKRLDSFSPPAMASTKISLRK
jgi:uncharacterized protein YajQ (UPF0234 family)